MSFLLGVFSSSLASFVNIKSKQILESMDSGEYQRTISFTNLMLGLPVCLLLNKDSGLVYSSEPMQVWMFVLLVFYLLLRIVANTASTSLYKDKTTDLNIVDVIISAGCFVSLGLSGQLISTSVLPIVLALVGVGVCIIDLSGKSKTNMSKHACICLLIFYLTSGSKAYMGNMLMQRFTAQDILMLEEINYFFVYLVMYRGYGLKWENVKRLLPLSMLSVLIALLTYALYSNILLYVIVSYSSTVFTAIFSKVILHKSPSRQTVIGVLIIVIAVTIFRLLYYK